MMFICDMLTICELPAKSVTFAVMLYVAASVEVLLNVVLQYPWSMVPELSSALIQRLGLCLVCRLRMRL